MVQASDYFCFWKVPLYLHLLSQLPVSKQEEQFPVSPAQAHALSTAPPPAAAEKVKKKDQKPHWAVVVHE